MTSCQVSSLRNSGFSKRWASSLPKMKAWPTKYSSTSLAALVRKPWPWKAGSLPAAFATARRNPLGSLR